MYLSFNIFYLTLLNFCIIDAYPRMLKAIKIVITIFFANRRSCPFPNSVFSVLSTFPVTCYVTNLVVFHNSTFQFQLMARFFTFRRIFDQWVLCTISSSFPNVVRCFFTLEIYVLSTLASYQIVLNSFLMCTYYQFLFTSFDADKRRLWILSTILSAFLFIASNITRFALLQKSCNFS